MLSTNVSSAISRLLFFIFPVGMIGLSWWDLLLFVPCPKLDDLYPPFIANDNRIVFSSQAHLVLLYLNSIPFFDMNYRYQENHSNCNSLTKWPIMNIDFYRYNHYYKLCILSFKWKNENIVGISTIIDVSLSKSWQFWINKCFCIKTSLRINSYLIATSL